MLFEHPALLQLLSQVRKGKMSGSQFGGLLIESLLSQIRARFLKYLPELLPIIFLVAGAILTVKLAWRLFRNFTKG